MRSDDIGRLRHLDTIEVILPAKDIPIGSKVRKTNGSLTFIIGDVLTLYTENGVKKEIKVDATSRILFSSGAFVHNTIGAEKKLVWEAPVDDVLACFDEVPQ